VVKLGDDRIVLSRPRREDVDDQIVVGLRRIFRDAGYVS
jgi:hypothetical protein